jgi:DivIVA domain-containing protein
MRRKKSEQQAAPARADGRVTPSDIQQVEFRLAFRGYNERDVDAFLDRLTEDLSWYLEENQRLRAGGSSVPGGVDGEAAGREADAIVARAREEATATVRRAEQEAAAIRATGGAAGDARGAVAPFLNVEREFLQSLGSLVQGHAEEIKQMVLALRAAATAPKAAEVEPATTAPDAEPAEPEAMDAQVATAAEIRERLGEPEPSQAPDADRVVVESSTEPAFSSEGAQTGEGRERSLRELFWGDD